MAGAGNKIALGTVQFGLPYGISNQRGQVPPTEVCAILDYCQQQNLNFIDTAAAYGTSEEVIGNCLAAQPANFNIISKLSPNSQPGQVAAMVSQSLQHLKQKRLYGYLYHDFKTYQQYPATLDELLKLKEANQITHIGFSLYYPHQLELLLTENIPCDLIQIPFNLLDQRFAYLFPILEKKNIQVHVRSVFLQGLLLTPPEVISPYFKPILPVVEQIRNMGLQHNISLPHLALGFTHSFSAVNKLVIGVTGLPDLISNLAYTKYLKVVEPLLPELKSLGITDEAFLLPFNWKTN